MVQMGVFENPYVDPERAQSVVANARFTAAGEAAQRRSVVLLKNGGVLPLAGSPKLYVEGIRREAAGKYGSVVDDPKQADVALIQVNAPYQVMKGGTFPVGYHEGDLAYTGAENAKELEAIRRAAASGKPTVVLMYMDRPAILSEFIGEVAAVMAHFSSGDEALLDVVFGRAAPGGKLPFNLPRDMESVKRQNPDTAHDIANPLFRFGFGMTYARQSQ
jgi:beta-glucosidase